MKHPFRSLDVPGRPSHAASPPRFARQAMALLLAATLAACTALGAQGPTGTSIRDAGELDYAGNGIQVVDLDAPVLQGLASFDRSLGFDAVFGEGAPSDLVIGAGDVLDVAIWEAPPAVLFGLSSSETTLAAVPQTAHSVGIPQQMVPETGSISIPFVGQLRVLGRTPAEIEREIVARLRGRAHDPQAVVRLVQNEARTVTVLGEVAASGRLPLTARGERLLDAIASAGGTRQEIGKSTVQLARAGTVAAMALGSVVADPEQNVMLRPGDIVTVLHQPYSFVALGAIGNSAEVPFEGTGLSLAEALGRVGGLNRDNADIRGVFVIRLEQRVALGDAVPADARTTQDGRVPVIYRLDLADPASLFAMQDFAIRDEDVLYVSTTPGADLQRLVSTLSSVAFSTIAIGNALQ